MNEKVLRIVEYNKIITRLAEYANSEPAKKLCLNLKPMKKLSEINRALNETEDALSHLYKKGSVRFAGNRDFTDLFRALAVGSSLSAAELLRLSSFLENVALVRAYGLTEEETKDSLFDLFDCLVPLKSLSSEIRRCILAEDEIADDASTALKNIRRRIREENDHIHSKLQQMVNSSASQYLMDSIITTRDDRYCLPVRAEFKAQIPGIVHDQSATGSTLFIEPSAVVDMNNTLRELEKEEQKEIENILSSLSLAAAEHMTELKDNAANMTQLDFIFARGNLSLDMEGSRPIMNEDHRVILRKARHPLLDKKKAVPIDISLGEDFDMVVITGPNTGGKTVTLKTVGLLELMGMAGLFIPAGDRSELSIFREVFADIGDEQSIEQSLSTFSAHMTNIVDILKRADKDCLVLIDELGAGTDPTEGAALAISILDFLHTRSIRTLATTHYSELKVYAMRTEGVINASSEFDVETLQPTYHLAMGIAGKSNAFAISLKLGLPHYIIEHAREQMNEETQNFEDLLTELDTERAKAEKEKEEARILRSQLDRREKELAEREKQLTEKRQEIIRRANESARDILANAKKEADSAIQDLRKEAARSSSVAGNVADTSSMEKIRSGLRDKVQKKDQKLAYRPSAAAAAKGKVRKEDLKIGDTVRVLSMGLTGTVEKLPDKKDNVGILCGIIHTEAKLSDLSYDDAPSPGVKNRKTPLVSDTKTDVDLARIQSISPEINLLGMTTDEAIMALDKYLDDAIMSHLHEVRVVHGKGTGALRKAVQEYLRKQRSVKSYRNGDFGEGDAGVTIVML